MQNVDEKETEESDEEVHVQVKLKKDYHSESEDSDEPEPLQPTLRRRSARSRGRTARGRGGTARGRSRGARGQAQTSTRGKSSGAQKGHGRGGGKHTSSEPKYPHSVPKEAVSIEVRDKEFVNPPPFQPTREVGPYVPDGCESSLELFFDANVINRIIRSTMSYAEHKKEEKKSRYEQFTKNLLTYAEVMAFLGLLILLGIHSGRNYRKAFSESKAQVLIRLHDLMTCHRFELIGSFIHTVTIEEESSLDQDLLKKIRPLQEYIKKKCLNLYQPLQNLSVDERMVKSKARCHLIQYMKNKPCKWGFKYWVIADPSGYTVDFELYTEQKGENGLAYDVVMTLCQNFKFQGYSLYVDNFYTGVALFENLAKIGISATGTLRTDPRGVPNVVKRLQKALSESRVPRGDGYYIRATSLAYVCWRDKRIVTAMSAALPGHGEEFVERRVKTKEGVTYSDFVPSNSTRIQQIYGRSGQVRAVHGISQCPQENSTVLENPFLPPY